MTDPYVPSNLAIVTWIHLATLLGCCGRAGDSDDDFARMLAAQATIDNATALRDCCSSECVACLENVCSMNGFECKRCRNRIHDTCHAKWAQACHAANRVTTCPTCRSFVGWHIPPSYNNWKRALIRYLEHEV